MIYLVIVGGLVVIVAALVRLDSPRDAESDRRPRSSTTRKPR